MDFRTRERSSFAEGAVAFETDAPEILKTVDAHFKHCLGEGESPLAQYQVRAGDETQFSILRDEKEFRSNLTREQALFHLMQDGLTQLNGAPKSHLIFHAAALAYQSRGLLLCGKSGSGKSTLAAWLTSNGFQYLTDEVIALPVQGNAVSGFPRSLVLKAGSSFLWGERLPQLDLNALLKFEDGSVWVPPQALNTLSVCAEVQPHLILFPTYTKDAPLQAEQLSTAGTLFHLLQCLVNARNFSDHGVERTKQLAMQTTAYRVIYSDLEQVSAWIRATITL